MPSPSVSHAARLIMCERSSASTCRVQAGILVPDQLLHAAGQGDDVGLAVVVQIGDDDLVAALQIGGDQVLGEFGWRRRGVDGRTDEARKNAEGKSRFSIIDVSMKLLCAGLRSLALLPSPNRSISRICNSLPTADRTRKRIGRRTASG